MKLSDFGIDFPVDRVFEADFWALIDGYNNSVSHLDCLQSELLGDVRAAFDAGLMTKNQADFIEENFIFSDEGFRNTKRSNIMRMDKDTEILLTNFF